MKTVKIFPDIYYMISRLKKISLFVAVLFSLLIFSQPAAAQAPQFETGLELYQNGDFERAASAFNKMQEPRAYLFAGKSYYAMQRYQQAQSNLNSVSPDSPAAIYYESIYTLALVDFQLKQFGDALSKLYQVLDKDDLDNSLTLDANRLYGQILDYLTADQRKNAINTVSAGQVKYDLLKSAMSRVSYTDARELLELYEARVEGDWRDKASEISSVLSSQESYRSEYGNKEKSLRPPEGTIYNLGIALPAYKPSANEFAIVKSLFMGAYLAGDDFNEEHNNAKVAIHFIDTGTGSGKIESAVEEFAENYQGDALIGPLFSEQAEPMIPYLNEYKIPAIAPLSNSQINAEGSYLFQANPTFILHGREMARYAVNELNMKQFAVFARRGSAGASSAEAFRDEAEKLGAHIQYYFVEDIRPNASDVSRYTQQLGSNEEPIDAVYAPITGQASLTLIDLLIADLRRMIEPPVVLGSQEWQRLDYSLNKYNRLHIYFTQGYYSNDHGFRQSKFRSDYKRHFNVDPNQFSMIGYDVAAFLLKTLDNVGNPALLKSAMLDQTEYQGLVNDISFDGGNTNKALKILEVSEGNVSVKQ